ncbi:PITH domain-containing protein 1-like [Xenia sp. Carnegie-2017]|uniref:PITH domain-containing protein 1-like n=1 Tax=Xenia sp. Carnegie-2017 TaxID=2897299 RepID=UPI001F04B488|nr:PITH domain-containing protein 1-like [Xenia sp. Carnegie-2017]
MIQYTVLLMFLKITIYFCCIVMNKTYVYYKIRYMKYISKFNMADCDGHNCSGHNHISEEKGVQYSLFTKIDFTHVEVLNEAEEGTGKTVFKPWEERLDRNKFVESDVDQELLFNIPFTGNVKLKGVIVMGGEGEQHPRVLKLYKNRPHMTFDETEMEQDQMFELVHDFNGTIEYTTKVPRFSSIQCLSMYFPLNYGAETTIITYIGLKGEFQEAHRHEVTICNYETRANPADHKTTFLNSVNHTIS